MNVESTNKFLFIKDLNKYYLAQQVHSQQLQQSHMA